MSSLNIAIVTCIHSSKSNSTNPFGTMFYQFTRWMQAFFPRLFRDAKKSYRLARNERSNLTREL